MVESWLHIVIVVTVSTTFQTLWMHTSLPTEFQNSSFNITLLFQLQLKVQNTRASLVAQWLRVCLPMQGTRVRVLVREDPTCRGATKPVRHNYWVCASGAVLRHERPRQWEAHAPRWRVVPTRHNWRKPSHRNEEPTQSKINKERNKFIKNKK